MNAIIPAKLKKNGHIRVIAPSRSRAILGKDSIEDAIENLQKYGFQISFSKHCDEIDEFNSSSIESRVSDIHDAFTDPSVEAILTVIGGYNSNQLLDYLDYELIASHPKIICGFSDITAVANAITAKTGLVTYIGPHFSSWAMKKGFEYSREYFLKACTSNNMINLLPSETWSDDAWYLDQDRRDFIANDGYWILNSGNANGKLIGGHMRCLNSLQGTKYWPDIKNTVIMVEEDAEILPALFDRQLQSLIHQKDFGGVRGIIIGRFQKDSQMSRDLLTKIVKSKQKLNHLPVIANVNIGHTTPIATFPVGGSVDIKSTLKTCSIQILDH